MATKLASVRYVRRSSRGWKALSLAAWRSCAEISEKVPIWRAVSSSSDTSLAGKRSPVRPLANSVSVMVPVAAVNQRKAALHLRVARSAIESPARLAGRPNT